LAPGAAPLFYAAGEFWAGRMAFSALVHCQGCSPARKIRTKTKETRAGMIFVMVDSFLMV
jgi:hypothetical protein